METLEERVPELREALQALATNRSAAAHCRVADEYRRLQVLDTAFDYYTQAVALDARDAAAFDGRARIWRDWGFPQLGVDDARRAVDLAPEAAPAYNTFGTLMYALGREAEARLAFERAAALDGDAAYAWTNLCYLSFEAGETSRAAVACQRAIDLAGPTHRPVAERDVTSGGSTDHERP